MRKHITAIVCLSLMFTGILTSNIGLAKNTQGGEVIIILQKQNTEHFFFNNCPDGKEHHLAIYNSSGEIVDNRSFTDASLTLNAEQLAEGAYTLVLDTGLCTEVQGFDIP